MKKTATLIAIILAGCGSGADEPTAIGDPSPEEQPAPDKTPAPAPPSMPAPPKPAPGPAPAPSGPPQLRDGVYSTMPCLDGVNDRQHTRQVTYGYGWTRSKDLEYPNTPWLFETPPAHAILTTHGSGATYSWWINNDGSAQMWTTLDGDAVIIGWGAHGVEPDNFIACGVALDNVDGIRAR